MIEEPNRFGICGTNIKVVASPTLILHFTSITCDNRFNQWYLNFDLYIPIKVEGKIESEFYEKSGRIPISDPRKEDEPFYHYNSKTINLLGDMIRKKINERLPNAKTKEEIEILWLNAQN